MDTKGIGRVAGLVVVFWIICTYPEKSENGKFHTLWNTIYENFSFLPEYFLEADLMMFFNHKNGYFKEKYYLESNTRMEFVLVSFRDIVHSVWFFEFQTGMGQTPGNIVFDPMDINFGIVPVLEYRLPMLNIQCGLNHHCFHEIDKKDYPTIYWNKLFVGAGSSNMRLKNYWQNLATEDGWTYQNRFSWFCQWGYYLRKFFGIIRESTINGENVKLHDFAIDARYAFYRRRSWIVNVRGETQIGYWKSLPSQPADNGVYWRQNLAVENNFRLGKRGAMIFLTYTIDSFPLHHGLPRLSKDQLIQIGLRFY